MNILYAKWIVHRYYNNLHGANLFHYVFYAFMFVERNIHKNEGGIWTQFNIRLLLRHDNVRQIQINVIYFIILFCKNSGVDKFKFGADFLSKCLVSLKKIMKEIHILTHVYTIHLFHDIKLSLLI